MLRELLNEEVPPQSVSLQTVKCAKLVVCYRDFRDCAASMWRVEKGGFSDDGGFRQATPEEAEKYARAMLTWAKRLATIRHDCRLDLRYEDWRSDLRLVTELARFMGLGLSAVCALNLSRRWSMAEVKKQADTREDWWQWDEDKQIHGHHVYKGEIGGWRRIFPEESHLTVTKILAEPLLRWDYITEIK